MAWNIVIAGGDFRGISAARRLEPALPGTLEPRTAIRHGHELAPQAG